MLNSRTHLAIPPGATIREQLADRHMPQKEFALRMDMSEKHISRLINGDVQLTPDVAVRLEMVLGVPAPFWLKLEASYREQIVKVKIENNLEEEITLARLMPYSEMVKAGWLTREKEWSKRVVQLRQYFEVAKLDLLMAMPAAGLAFRRLGKSDKSIYASLAWLQQVKRMARAIPSPPFDHGSLERLLPHFRSMTRQNPEQIMAELTDALLSCGISLIFLNHVRGSFLHGVSMLHGKSIVIGLTARGKYADRFWFSFFHELAHVLTGHLSLAPSEVREREADGLARHLLIPKDQYETFIAASDFSQDAIIRFAEHACVAAGIVVGRLQKDKQIAYNQFNDLKMQVERINTG